MIRISMRIKIVSGKRGGGGGGESAAVKIIQAVRKICRITIRLIYFFMPLNKASNGGR